MPVTKTAKRALRGSQRKRTVNKNIVGRLDSALRKAKKTKTAEAVRVASSLADRASKNKVIHKNKAARIKSRLSKLLSKKTSKAKVPAKKSPTKKAPKKK